MNKTYKFPALWMMCLMLFSCLTFTACDNGDDEDTSVANLSSVGCLLDGTYCLLYILVANHYINENALDTTGIVHHATVYPGLAHLALSTYIIVRKPLDVGGKQCFLYILELCLTDDSFNLFHVYLS